MAEAVDVAPLPAAEVGPGAVEQGQGGGDVVLPPLLVGHLDRPPVLEPLELLPLLLGFGPRLPPRRPVPPRRPPSARLAASPSRASTASALARSAARQSQAMLPRTPPATSTAAARPYAAASAGRRRTHSAARSTAPAGRAAIGSPASQARRSSASAWALDVAPPRVLLQALQADRLQVARRPGALSRGGGSGGRVRAPASSVSTTLSPPNGGRPVSSS